jgi:hypothetical protein
MENPEEANVRAGIVLVFKAEMNFCLLLSSVMKLYFGLTVLPPITTGRCKKV